MVLWQFMAISCVTFAFSVLAAYLSIVRYINIRDFTEMQIQLEALADLYSALSTSHKRLRSRVGMRELRERRKGDQEEQQLPLPTNDPYNSADQLTTEEQRAAWKREMRVKLHRGEIKP
jgi:hypothetical protein